MTGTGPREQREGVRRQYDAVGSEYAERYSGTRGQYFRRLEADYVFALADVRGRDLLDVGTGTGRIAERALREEGAASAVGVDISNIVVRGDGGPTSLSPAPSFALMDGAALGLRDDCVDVVTSIGTFEYVADMRPFLREFDRVLRPDGRVVFTVHNAAHRAERDGGPDGYDLTEHTRASLESQLADCGFRITELRETFYANGFVWRWYNRFERRSLNRAGAAFVEGAILFQRLLSRIGPPNVHGGELVVLADRST